MSMWCCVASSIPRENASNAPGPRCALHCRGPCSGGHEQEALIHRVRCTVHKVVLQRRATGEDSAKAAGKALLAVGPAQAAQAAAAPSWLFAALPTEQQLCVEITPVGFENQGQQTAAREARWGRAWGEASWAFSDEEGASLSFDILPSTELSIRVLGFRPSWQCRGSQDRRELGEARFLPSAGLCCVPLLQDGHVSGTASLTVRLQAVEPNDDPLPPYSHAFEYDEVAVSSDCLEASRVALVGLNSSDCLLEPDRRVGVLQEARMPLKSGAGLSGAGFKKSAWPKRAPP